MIINLFPCWFLYAWYGPVVCPPCFGLVNAFFNVFFAFATLYMEVLLRAADVEWRMVAGGRKGLLVKSTAAAFSLF